MNAARTALLAVGALCALTHWWTRLPRLGDGQVSGSGSGPAVVRLGATTKVLTTLLAIGVASTADAPAAERLIAAIALVLCLAGDIALLDQVDRFLGGLGAFLLGHLAFVVLFVRYGIHPGPRPALAVVLGCLLAATAGRRILSAARTTTSAYTVPVVVYLVTILAMAAVGWSTSRPRVWLGVTAFIVSDTVLGWEQFVDRHRWMPVAVMSTYHVAIFALALSV